MEIFKPKLLVGVQAQGQQGGKHEGQVRGGSGDDDFDLEVGLLQLFQSGGIQKAANPQRVDARHHEEPLVFEQFAPLEVARRGVKALDRRRQCLLRAACGKRRGHAHTRAGLNQALRLPAVAAVASARDGDILEVTA